jgi:hypothetical protein
MPDEERLPLSDEDLDLIEQMRSWLLERGVTTVLPFQAKLLIESEIPRMVRQIRLLRQEPGS